MGKVIYSQVVSLDGYTEDTNHALDWAIVDEEFHRFVNDQERQLDAFLYGRRTWEAMVAFWPTADETPSQPEYVVDFAHIWKSKPKIVFSKSLDEVGWDSRLVRGDAGEAVAKLKEEFRGDLGLGGAGLAASLMRLGLVDEYDLYVNPVILGGGTPMFPELPSRIGLRLTESRTFGSGVVHLRYRLGGN